MFNTPDNQPNFSVLEDALTQWWKQEQIFEKSISLREGAQEYIFYDGPPFMSGMPHYATLLSSLSKDAIPRYRTMKGEKVDRLWGWDCHGLPIEQRVEKELGLNGRREILDYGLDKFIEKCYEWNRVGIENWRWYIDKIGRWADMDNAYRTMDQDYMESVWWAFKQLWDKKLIYKGNRTSLFSTDSSTPVSDFEVSMDADNYRDTEDLAVTVKFKLQQESISQLGDLGTANLPVYMLAWTTTPWTLPSNFALAVNPSGDYLVVKHEGEILIVGKERYDAVIGETNTATTISELKGEQLVGLTYEQLLQFLPGKENDFKVYGSDYVTSEDGTGILHVAPAFGEADFEMGTAWNLSFTADIDETGKLTVGPWQGTYLRDANQAIADHLHGMGNLFKQEKYNHRLPYYRYDNPLIYKVQENYFIDVQKLKPQLLESNKQINWVPDHFGSGRFQHIIETAPDWSISRSRFWGTAMPIWESIDGEQLVVGSRDELMGYVNSNKSGKMQKLVLKIDNSNPDDTETGLRKLKELIADETNEEITYANDQYTISAIRNQILGESELESKHNLLVEMESRSYYLYQGKVLDMHRPYIDSVEFEYQGKHYKRIEETLDVWLDSGSMPFAQFHYPKYNRDKFEHNFPGDFISEYTGQIRAWFNILHIIANGLFDKPAFKNVLVTGVLAGNDGRKMSKSFGNYPDPKLTLEKYGGDALRLYFLGSTLMAGNDMDFSEEDLQMQVREFLIPLWNTYKYLVTYAQIHDWHPTQALAENNRHIEGDQHPWDHLPFEDIPNELDAWILTKLQNTIGEVTQALDSYQLPVAVRAIKDLLNETSKWYIRRSRDRFNAGEQRPLEVLYYVLVELCKLAAPITPFIAEHIYRELVGNQFRDLPESVHLCDFPVVDLKLLESYQNLLPEMELVRELAEMGQILRTSSGLKVRQPLAELQVEFSAEMLQKGTYLPDWMRKLLMDELNVLNVHEVPSVSESPNLLIQSNKTGHIKVALNVEITPELKEKGLVREVIRTFQALRKNAGLEMGEPISISYDSADAELEEIITKYKPEIMKAISAKEIIQGNGEEKLEVNDFQIRVTLNREK